MKSYSPCIICGSKTRLFLSRIFDDRYGAPGYCSIYKCESCGFGRTEPVLKKDEIGIFYSKYYPIKRLSASEVKKRVDLDNKLGSWLNGVNNVCHLYIKKGSDVLDIGSASGVSLLEIEKLGGSAYGVEPDPNSRKLAKALGLKVFKGFLTDDPFPKKKFDFVTASQVIEHEPDPLKFFMAAKNKLKPKGQIILSFPNVDSFYRRIFGKSWIHWHVPYHINHFSKRSIEILADKTGLKVVKIETITPNLWTILQMRTLLTRSIYKEPSSVWETHWTRGSRSVKRNTFVSTILGYTIPLMPIVIISINRLIDLFGQGESFLVFLDKK